jgi:hypothetical protein
VPLSAANVAVGSKCDPTAPKRDFRCTPGPDIDDRAGHVGFVPNPEVAPTRLLDHLVRTTEQRYFDAQ